MQTPNPYQHEGHWVSVRGSVRATAYGQELLEDRRTAEDRIDHTVINAEYQWDRAVNLSSKKLEKCCVPVFSQAQRNRLAVRKRKGPKFNSRQRRKVGKDTAWP